MASLHTFEDLEFADLSPDQGAAFIEERSPKKKQERHLLQYEQKI